VPVDQQLACWHFQSRATSAARVVLPLPVADNGER